ncbi:hypothetical protein [Streptomyces sp. NPDC001502]|uniref:hypothetical protein n=1 Tax=Streptomyces sp. NPDC001502 TaxID=3364578 RepID=UPI0036CC1434
MQHFLCQRLNGHARWNWPQLTGVTVRYRAGFAYVAGELMGGDALPLCRLRCAGVLHTWGFALISPAVTDMLTTSCPAVCLRALREMPWTVLAASTSATL